MTEAPMGASPSPPEGLRGLTVSQAAEVEAGQPPTGAVSTRLTSDEAAALARASGLHAMGTRPPLARYIQSVWARRSFIWNLSASRAYTRNQGSYLGQAWNIIRPTLDAAVYIIVFGFVFGGSDDVSNIAAFITIGTFSYALFSNTLMRGVDSIPANLALVRSHQFPRAVVPFSTAMTELVLFVPTLVVMVVISLLTGLLPRMGSVTPQWSWLLIPVAVGLFGLFSTGVALFFARLGARTPDIANVLPFFLSLGRFGSGVMFSVVGRIGQDNLDSWWALTIQRQPLTVYLDLIRACFGNEPTVQHSPLLWGLAIGYATIAFVLGFIFFWASEETYGRD